MATGYGLGLPNLQFSDDNGVPLNGGKLYTYVAGTSTPQSTYQDSALTILNANPVVLDSAGRCVVYIPVSTGYKLVLKTSADVDVWTQDNVALPATPAPPAPAAVPTGTILAYGGTSAPSGYLLCDGSAVSRSTYAALFAVIATAYGAGDGSTTFNVPNMVGRFAFGKAASGTGSTLGGTFGNIDHVHTGPSHTHTVSGTTTGPSSVFSAVGTGTNVGDGTHTHDFSATSSAAGTGNTGTGNPPALTHNHIIKV